MLTYIITRFSIYDYNTKHFKATRNLNKFEYKKQLFSEDRLNYKFKSFELITLPSVLNQTNQNYIWYIYSSIYLPEIYKQRLLDLTNNNPKIICTFIESFKYFNKINQINTKYCTIRLDDDDGLSHTFIEKLNLFKHEKDKTIISHPNGRKCKINNGNVIHGTAVHIKNVAIGLCAIGMNIYNCGDHTSVHKKFRVIYNNTPNMYMVNCSPFCDTKRIM